MKIDGLDCILLIDDDPATNFLNKHIIKKSGIECHIQIARDGQEALDYLSHTIELADGSYLNQPGIIFLDINMPGMGGWEFLEQYERLSKERKAKVLIAMLTTSFNPSDEERARENANIAAFLNKPLSLPKFETVLQMYTTTLKG